MFQITKQHIYRDARDAYFHGGKTQKDIAKEVGISERTLRNWIKEGCWDRLRQDANVAPAVMIDQFCSQLAFIQTNIANRPPEERMPTPAEIEMQRKLLNCIISVKNYPSEHIKCLAWGIHPVSSPIPITDEELPEEENKINYEAPLISRYIAFEGNAPATNRNQNGKKAAKMFQLENEGSDTPQTIDNSGEEEVFEEENEERKAEETGSLAYVRKKNVTLSSGAIWLQKGQMYDPELQCIRRMTPDEWDELIGLGVGRLDFDGWCIAMP